MGWGQSKDEEMKQVLTEALNVVKVSTEAKERRNCNFHILFIGASGAGKTSLLNLFGQFGFIHEYGLSRIITEFKLYNDAELERNKKDQMSSKTSSTKSYCINIGNITIMITDTPGLGVDSAGMGKEKENVRDIVEFLKSVDCVDCICLIVNGRTPRGIPEVKYALSEISALLPNVVSNNMILCLTNVENITMVSFDTEILNDFFKREIEKQKTFCIENPVCRLERMLKLNEKTEPIKEVYVLAAKEFHRILLSIKDFNPLHTTCFMEVYMAKQEVEREILAITVHQHNQKQLDTLKGTGKMKFTHITISEDAHYNTLCDYPGCYCICHPQCNLPHSFDTEIFKNCYCMGGSRSMCKVCDHSYTMHYHQYVKFTYQELDLEYDNIADRVKKETGEALKRLSEKIEKFNELSSAKSYLKVLKTQLEVIELHQRTNGSTEALEVAGKRIKTAMEMTQKKH